MRSTGMMRQFVATVYLIQEEKFLLHFHAKHRKWLPPGGHLEPNETPQEAALREVKEETGLDLEFITDDLLHIDAPRSKSLVRPILCLLEEIPANNQTPAHQHIDFIFLARPVGATCDLPNGFQWFSLQEIASLDVFPDIYPTCSNILTSLASYGPA